MESVPPEILSHIFAFACTDDGYTGRSLSLVSKYINVASRPYKLQCVAVRGVWQVVKFACVLEREIGKDGKGMSEGRGVKHLFLSCDRAFDLGGAARLKRCGDAKNRPAPAGGRVLGFDQLFWPVGDFLSSVYSYFFPDPQDIQQAKADAKRIKGELELRNHHPIILYQAFHWILKAVAPTIETLSVAVEHSFLPTTPMNPNSESTSEPKEPDITPRVYPIFPNLTELTIAHPRSWPLPSPADCPFPKDSYPSLKRVDLSGVRHYIHPVNLLFNICNLTPGVTHIHLPTFDSMHIRYFAEHLDQSLAYINNQNPVNVHGETVDRFPETVERVVIQLRPMKDIFTELLDSYLERFREVAQKDERFVFVRRKWVSVEDEPLEQEKRWLDRLEGGEGCWNSEGSIVQGI